MKLRIFVMALWGLTTLVATAPNAKAQGAPMPVVKAIDVQFVGPETVSRDKILANMRTRVGKAYSPNTTEEDIRNLYATGNVSNVRIFGEPQTDGVKVIVVVATKSTISEVGIRGNLKFKESKLRDQISTKPGDALSEATLEADRQKILDYYRGKGFGDIDVRYRTEGNERQGTSKVYFDITEGAKTKIDRVVFEGNSSISSRELSKVVKSKPKGVLNVFSATAGKLNEDQLEDDARAIRELYQGKGFADVEVRRPSISRRGEKVDITFPIVEGRKYTIGKVTYSGARALALADVVKPLKVKAGSVYSPAEIRNDIKAIQDLYGAKGYVDLQIAASPSPAGPGVVDLNFRMEEGLQSTVNRVNITGNDKTKPNVIRRELAVYPGDIFNTVRVDGSRQRLMNTQFFSKVEMYPTETMVPGQKDLNVIVEEKRTGNFSFGAGFSSIDNLLGYVEMTQGNFDILSWRKGYGPSGGGQKFRMRAQYGTRRQDFVLALTEPYFMDKKLSVGGELFYRNASFTSSVYDERRLGFALNVRKPINDFTSMRFEYRLEDTSLDLSDDEDNVSPEMIDLIDRADGLKSQLSVGITRDTRNKVYLPSKGYKVDAQAFVSGGFLGGDVNTYGLNLEGSQYFQLPWDMILSFEGEIGSVTEWSGSDDVPIYDRLYLGGPNSLRGFGFRDVGPKDSRGEPIGGKTLVRFSSEVTFPVVESVRGAVFYDVGFVNDDAWKFSPSDSGFNSGGLNSNVGIGLLIELPAIGPVRIDYGIPIQSDVHNDSGGKFQFNVGYKF
jgi:outer membrane protein insertion porin family